MKLEGRKALRWLVHQGMSDKDVSWFERQLVLGAELEIETMDFLPSLPAGGGEHNNPAGEKKN